MIGSGAAGSSAARSLVASGWDVTIAENDRVGGTCLWKGCMPKKALYNSAKYRRALVRAETFGIGDGSSEFDWPSVLAWKWHAQETYAGDQEAGLADRGIRLARGAARFVSPEQVRVNEEVFEPDAVIIATGSRAFVPQIPGAELADTSEQALHYPQVPASLLIVGGGFIGLEFAGIFASFGSRVTVAIRGNRPIEALDPDTSAIAIHRLEALGVHFMPQSRLESITGDAGSLSVRITDPTGDAVDTTFERVLLATGRRPALDDLGLEAAGIETDSRGHLVLDPFQRTTNPAVWAAGDVTGGRMQTPIAGYEGRMIARSIDTGVPVELDCHAAPLTMFTTPQLAQVGLSESDATERGIAYRVSKQTFEFLGAAVIEDERDGLVKLLFDADSDVLIGAHIAAPDASDLIYALAVALKMNATAGDLRDVVGVHPAYCEAINWASF